MLEKRARYHCLSSLININRYSTDFVSSINQTDFRFGTSNNGSMRSIKSKGEKKKRKIGISRKKVT